MSSSRIVIVGSVINPLALTPALWIDFADAATVTTVSGNVSQVNDKSSNGRNFTQGTAGNRPSYQTAVQNGLNVARFDGTTDRLEIGTSGLGRNVGALSIYVVRKYSAAPSSIQVPFAINTATNVTRAYVRSVATGRSNAGGRRLDADSFQSLNGTNLISGTLWQFDTAVFDYANSDLFLYMDNVLEGSTTSFQTAGNTSNTDSLSSSIGAAPGGATLFAGDIGEVLVFNAAHDAATRARVWGYLRNKWAI